MGYKSILLKRESGVATITLNRAENMNGLDQQMCKELVAVTEEVAQDSEVKVVVLTGSGKAFCAGS